MLYAMCKSKPSQIYTNNVVKGYDIVWAKKLNIKLMINHNIKHNNIKAVLKNNTITQYTHYFKTKYKKHERIMM